MSITKSYINNDLSALQLFLQSLTPTFFESVVYDDTNGTITIYDSDENVLLEIASVSASSKYGYIVTLYADSDTSVQCNAYTSTAGTIARITYGFVCDNGAMITFTPSGSATLSVPYDLMIAKTQNGKTVFILGTSMTTGSSSSAPENMETVYSVAYGDTAPIKSFSWKDNESNQTILQTFPTNCGLGEQSYTPDAGYLQCGQYYSMGHGKVWLNNTLYLTNGYWAIKDGGAS